MIISVTGLKPKGFWALLRFWVLAIPAFRQAKRARGCLFCEARFVDGVAHTLTAWKGRKYIKHFVLSGAHRKAMGQFGAIATGAIISFEADRVPSWDEAVQKWRDEGQWY